MFKKMLQKAHDLKINWELQKAMKKMKRDPLLGRNVNEIKAKYGHKFIELREIVNLVDPMRLMIIGAPQDEYESEVKTIIVQLDNVNNKEDTLELVFSEFTKWFGVAAGNKEKYLQLASDIFNWKTNQKD